MKIAHIIPTKPGSSSGILVACTLLSKSLNLMPGVASTVYSTGACTAFEVNGEKVFPSREMDAKGFDIVDLAGVYSLAAVCFAARLRYLNVPYIVTPHGSLTKASIKKSSIRKQLFISLFGKVLFGGAQAIRFLSESERRNSLQRGSRSFCVGNGVGDEIFRATSGAKPVSPFKKVFGFLGRLDVNHKGLDVFIDEVIKHQGVLRRLGWLVKIYGPSYYGGRSWIIDKVNKSNIKDLVCIGGRINGVLKSEFFFNVGVFVHLSRYEGQPQAVMESMAHGCAIYVSPGANMDDAITVGRAGWCSGDVDILSVMTSKEIEKRRSNALVYARSHYRWDDVAREYLTTVGRLMRRSDP